MSWEQRMAERSAVRRAAVEPEPAGPPPRNDRDEAAIAAQVAHWTPEAIAEWRAGPPIWCACTGGPPGCTLCSCHIRAEAIARVEGQPCPWCTA